MQAIPLTRRHHLQAFTGTLEAHGFSSERIIGRLGLPMWQYGDPDDLIPLRDVLSVLAQAARTVGDERLGLLVGARSRFTNVNAIGKLIAASPTMYRAMKTTCRVANTHTSLARLWLVDAGDTVWFCRAQFPGMSVGLRQHEQFIMMGAMLDIVRLGAGATWKPAEIWLCTPRQPRLEETDALSGVRIRYGQSFGAIAVPRSTLGRPLLGSSWSASSTRARAKRWIGDAAPGDDFAGSLRQVLTALVPEGLPSVAAAAEIVGLSTRTLQRCLNREGTTYKDVVARVRYETAVELLEEPDAQVTEIAFHVGYEHLPDFTRAFRRWAGVTPSEYRRLREAA